MNDAIQISRLRHRQEFFLFVSDVIRMSSVPIQNHVPNSNRNCQLRRRCQSVLTIPTIYTHAPFTQDSPTA